MGTACGREKIIPFSGAAGFRVSTTVPMLDLAKNLIYVYTATIQCNSIEFFHDYCIIKTKFKNGEKISLRFNQIGNFY